MPDGYCRDCKEYTPKLIRGRCTKCYQAYDLNCTPIEIQRQNATDSQRRRKAFSAALYDEWKERLVGMPTRLLTPDDWLRACKHFNGCAWCGSDSIDAKTYFVPFREGGKYTATNILPACDVCATKLKKQPNAFLTMWVRQDREEGPRASTKQLEKIVDYLDNIIEEELKHE